MIGFIAGTIQNRQYQKQKLIISVDPVKEFIASQPDIAINLVSIKHLTSKKYLTKIN
jgi:hypothetical protein